MSSSILPERPLLVSPELAATIGLEEAIILQALAERIQFSEGCNRPGQGDTKWISLSEAGMLELFPFWQSVDIRRIQRSLQSLGMLKIEPNEADESTSFFALDDSVASTRMEPEPPRAESGTARVAVARTGSAALIAPDWQPDSNWIRQCTQQGIPEDFLRELVPEFVSYWRDRGQARFSWGNAFYKWAIKEWRAEQTRRGRFEQASAMSANWMPSGDAIEILINAGISQSFIEDAIPEFVLYWRERGVGNAAWNTKFIEHIRRQWAKFSASFGYDDTPKPIAPNWQPSADCYEVLQLAEIDEDYARTKIPEFVMYWRDSQQARASWNTVFLQFIKQDWARRLERNELTTDNHAEDQSLAGTNQQRIKERFQRIADRSWAD